MRLLTIPILLREVFSKRTLPREPEPDLVMDDEEQVRAYSEAGRIDGIMAAAYLFNSARISAVIQGARSVVDLGCGPATQLAQVAEFNPDIEFLGTDLSETMLESARSYTAGKGLNNIQLFKGDITALPSIQDHSADAVICTMVLHHLPDIAHLRACFREITRILKPGGALYLVDFGRLKLLKSVLYFAYLNAAHQPHLFSLDYERSLRAAFLFEDFVTLAREELPEGVEVLGTFPIPLLTLLKTTDRPLPPTMRLKLKVLRNALPRKYRRDLDEIRLLFRLGGLKNDPFSD